MAEKEIKIGFPETKMEALEFFLRENDTTVEKVLKEHLDKTYEKSVPQQVRKFVESKMTASAEDAGQSEDSSQRQEDREDAVPDRILQGRVFRNRKILVCSQNKRLWNRNPGRSRIVVWS